MKSRKHTLCFSSSITFLPSSTLWKWNKFWTERELICKIKDYISLLLNIIYLTYYTFVCFRYELTNWNNYDSCSFVVSSLSYVATYSSRQLTLPSSLFTKPSITFLILIAWLEWHPLTWFIGTEPWFPPTRPLHSPCYRLPMASYKLVNPLGQICIVHQS